MKKAVKSTVGRILIFYIGSSAVVVALLPTFSRRGVPAAAVLASTVVEFMTVGLNYLAPEVAFLFLVNTSGAIALFVWDTREALLISAGLAALVVAIGVYRYRTGGAAPAQALTETPADGTLDTPSADEVDSRV